MPLIYRDEFQMRYLLSNYIQIKIQHGEYRRDQIEELRAEIKRLFPFWDDVILNDAFLGNAVPRTMATRECMTEIHNHLTESKTKELLRW